MVIETPTRTATLADQADVAAILETLPPDAKRDKLADDYRHRADQLAAIRSRGQEIRARLTEIRVALPDVAGKERKALIDERFSLAVELDLLPDDTTIAVRRYAEALIAWAALTYRQVQAEGNAVVDAIEANGEERRRLHRAVVRFDESTRNVDANPVGVEAARQGHRDLMEREAPLRRRRREAEAVLSAITATLRGHFGEQVRFADVQPRYVDLFVERARKVA